jgi:hypothetical protein
MYKTLDRVPGGGAVRALLAATILTALSASGCHRHSCPSAIPSRGSWAGATPIRSGDAVFFVGNSFFGWQGRSLPDWVAALGQAMTPRIEITTGSDIVIGNHPLGGFLGHPATRQALASRKYQVYVLQGEEMEAVDHKAAFQRAVRDFNRAVVAAGGRTVLFMTWEFPWRRFIDQVAASYDEIGRELGIPVIPVGLVYQDCGCRPFAPGLSPHWLTADAAHRQGDLHPNEQGAAVNAYATFEMLTGINPAGRNFVAPGNSNDDAMMKYLSAMAWARVSPRLSVVPASPLVARRAPDAAKAQNWKALGWTPTPGAADRSQSLAAATSTVTGPAARPK